MESFAILPVRGGHAIIDSILLPDLSQYKWQKNKKGYIRTNVPKEGGGQKTILMHQMVNDTMQGFQTDHINGIRWDNRFSNLRTATQSIQSRNRRKGISKSHSSQYKGVYKSHGKWRAMIRAFGPKMSLGSFECEHEAARAYNEAAIKYFGEYAVLNEINHQI